MAGFLTPSKGPEAMKPTLNEVINYVTNEAMRNDDRGAIYDRILALIAHREDLLESLKQMVDMFERHIDGREGPDDAAERWDNARAAISNAYTT
jgi:hypothetical protein